MEFLVTNPYDNINPEEHVKILEEEKFYKQLALEEIREGWLKPQKQLTPFNSRSKINHLPKIRAREKKQIFLLAA